MKKKFLAFSILLGWLLATPSYASNINDFSCVLPYDLSKSFSSKASKFSGANLAASKVAGSILKSQISKNADGKFNVKVDSYSVPDLKEGRFRGLEIKGKNVVAEGVYFSAIDMKTLCDFNYIVYNKSNSSIVFKEDFPMSFSVTFSESDLNNTMQAKGYLKMIDKMNDFGKKYSLYEIVSTTSWLKENKFIYAFNVKFPIFGGSSVHTLALRSDLIVDDGKVVMKNPELINAYAKISLSKLTKAFEYLNPFVYSLDIMEDENAQVIVRNVNIVNNKINISGVVNVPKGVLTQHKG